MLLCTRIMWNNFKLKTLRHRLIPAQILCDCWGLTLQTDSSVGLTESLKTEAQAMDFYLSSCSFILQIKYLGKIVFPALIFNFKLYWQMLSIPEQTFIKVFPSLKKKRRKRELWEAQSGQGWRLLKSLTELSGTFISFAINRILKPCNSFCVEEEDAWNDIL